TLVFNNDGSYTFTPGSDFDALGDTESRDVTFTYTATDDDGAVYVNVTSRLSVSPRASKSLPGVNV
ncbi:Ig-like domain-containing protein, partial [Vibrio toranzoniae]|uniref:Ig-like domain-containing protein n=1 Tax=Vibrio toranzoniae TaxID=1194427 RepID=UPI001377A940